jgi:hypothetical protein
MFFESFHLLMLFSRSPAVKQIQFNVVKRNFTFPNFLFFCLVKLFSQLIKLHIVLRVCA